MIKQFSLQPLINLTQHQNDSATRKLGMLNEQQKNAQDKLDILLGYRKDYQNKLQEAARNGMSPADLRNFEHFMHKLDEAIAQQLKLVDSRKASTQLGRNEFDATQRKLKSFDTLKQRHIEEQKLVANKFEQKVQDEHSTRLSAHKILTAEDPNN